VSAGWQRLMLRPPLFGFVAAEWASNPACLGQQFLFAMVEGSSRRLRPCQIFVAVAVAVAVAVEVMLSGRRPPPRWARPLQNDAAHRSATNCTGKPSYVYIYIADGSDRVMLWLEFYCLQLTCMQMLESLLPTTYFRIAVSAKNNP
jgi:hypothetical protein